MSLDLQKASLWKRASAFLLDAILLVVLATGLFFLIGTCTGYDDHLQVVTEAKNRIAAEYGVTDEMAYKATEDLTEEELAAINGANAAIAADEAAVYAFQMVTTLSTLTIALGLLGAFLLMEFAIPMFLGNGQTLGKKIFGLGVMHTEFIRLKPVALFVRTVLGKFAVGTMPFAMTGLFLLSGLGSPYFLLIAAAILLTQLILLIATRDHALLHDKMALTVVVDLASQMIFDTPEQMLEYKKKAHAQRVADSTY